MAPGPDSSDRASISGTRRPGWLHEGADWAVERVTELVGGPARRRVIGLLALVLALNSADVATVGASGGQLESALSLSNTQLGLLVALPALIGAVATLPMGMLTDRVRRTRLLAIAVLLWSAAQFVSGAAGSFSSLLLIRLLVGGITAAAGPSVASLTGDFFPARERGRIYGFILTGELVGAGFGFLVSGEVAAALSWRFAFFLLALPGFALAWALWTLLPEPARGGQSRLEPGARRIVSAERARRTRSTPDEHDDGPERDDETAQEAVRHDHVEPDPDLVLDEDPQRMRLGAAVRYVLRVRTNPTLIAASSLGYFFLAGIETFGVVFIAAHYNVGHATATALLALVGLGAVIGILVGGRVADRLIQHGKVNARIIVAAIGYLVAAACFIPGVAIGSLIVAIPVLMVGAAGLSAPNPPLDAARLDIMHSRLWGRAESVRTVARQVATALAPLLFGLIADAIGPGGHSGASGFGAGASGKGLEAAFLVMVVPLIAAGLIMLRALKTYPRDVATAMASEERVADHVSHGVQRRSQQRAGG